MAQKIRGGVKRVRKVAVISERVVRVGLVNKAIFKQRLEGESEPCSYWGASGLGGGNSQYKGPEAGLCWISREACMAGVK